LSHRDRLDVEGDVGLSHVVVVDLVDRREVVGLRRPDRGERASVDGHWSEATTGTCPPCFPSMKERGPLAFAR
jgi:hypothetical protein